MHDETELFFEFSLLIVQLIHRTISSKLFEFAWPSHKVRRASMMHRRWCIVRNPDTRITHLINVIYKRTRSMIRPKADLLIINIILKERDLMRTLSSKSDLTIFLVFNSPEYFWYLNTLDALEYTPVLYRMRLFISHSLMSPASNRFQSSQFMRIGLSQFKPVVQNLQMKCSW